MDPEGFAKRYSALNDELTTTQRQLINIKKERNELRKKLQQQQPGLKELLSSMQQLVQHEQPAPQSIENLRAILQAAEQPRSPPPAAEPSGRGADTLAEINLVVQQLQAQQGAAAHALEAAARIAVEEHYEAMRSSTRAKLAETDRESSVVAVETELSIDELRLRAMEMESALNHQATQGDVLDQLELAHSERLLEELDGAQQEQQASRRMQFRASTLQLMAKVASSMEDLDRAMGTQLNELRGALEVGSGGYSILSVLRDVLGADEEEEQGAFDFVKVGGDDTWNHLALSVETQLSAVKQKAALLHERNDAVCSLGRKLKEANAEAEEARKACELAVSKGEQELEVANSSRLRSEKARMETEGQLAAAMGHTNQHAAAMAELHSLREREAHYLESEAQRGRQLLGQDQNHPSTSMAVPSPMEMQQASQAYEMARAQANLAAELEDPLRVEIAASDLQRAKAHLDTLHHAASGAPVLPTPACLTEALAEVQMALEAIELQISFAEPISPGSEDMADVWAMMQQLNKGAPPPPQSMHALESLEQSMQAPQLRAIAKGLSEQLQQAWGRAVTVRNQAKWLGWMLTKAAAETPVSNRPTSSPSNRGPIDTRGPAWNSWGDWRPNFPQDNNQMMRSNQVDYSGTPKSQSQKSTPRRNSNPNSFRDEASKIVSSFLERHDRARPRHVHDAEEYDHA